MNPNGQLSESRVSPSTGNVSHRIYKSAGFCFSLNADSFLIGPALMIAIRQLSRTITWIFETMSVVDPGPRILCTPCLLNLKDQLCSTCLHTKVHTSAHLLYTAHWIRFSVRDSCLTLGTERHEYDSAGQTLWELFGVAIKTIRFLNSANLKWSKWSYKWWCSCQWSCRFSEENA